MADHATARLPARLPGPAGLAQIPGVRQLLVLLGIAAAIAIGITVAVWSRSPVLAPLYTGLDERDASQVVQALQASGDGFKLDASGTAVLVAEGDVARLRLRLAAQGLPQGGVNGVAAEPEASPFGMSDFAEKARYQKRLEGELMASIGSLQPVKASRVHLALPKQSAFVRDRRPASASVVVTLFPGRRLEADQVNAIVHLVASSVPDLDPSQVSVIDHKGELLTANRAGDSSAMADGRFRVMQNVEQAYAGRIVALLTPLVGPGRVRAQVVANLDFTETERTSEQYDPAASVLRSEQVSNQQRGNANMAEGVGVPGALSNQPPVLPAQPTAATPVAAAAGIAAAPGTATVSASDQSSSATRNFEIDRVISRTREPTGTIRRLSVAVVVDNKASIDEEGEVVTEPLSQTELAQMMELVRGAVGYDEARGDSVSVINAPFHVEPDVEALPPPPLWQQPAVREIGKQVLGAIVLLVLALSVVRPLLRSLIALTPAPVAAANALLADAEQVDVGDGRRVAMSGPGALPALPKVGFEQKVGLAKRMVNEDPRQVAQVVKTWLSEDGG
ncbi:MAG: flagellar M-ring protein FliF [Lysobacterales bacterium CG17_big_fil_post_rev_8_21_14_2_50_64_11]|nr:MAG: flagellar M-ring protein FliF [Xanthomonadales bacterium CG17_big_fil_post_rev_8_21_14_2_50_64_11]PIX59432.1 MAG: flagellar M-ring protein FliF [Xanthomonadales bacterium CG_4_10_14_3_um_filter_64_11]